MPVNITCSRDGYLVDVRVAFFKFIGNRRAASEMISNALTTAYTVFLSDSNPAYASPR
jgi:hypothetical protein